MSSRENVLLITVSVCALALGAYHSLNQLPTNIDAPLPPQYNRSAYDAYKVPATGSGLTPMLPNFPQNNTMVVPLPPQNTDNVEQQLQVFEANFYRNKQAAPSVSPIQELNPSINKTTNIQPNHSDLFTKLINLDNDNLKFQLIEDGAQIDNWQKEADKGNAGAQLDLAYAYYIGFIVKTNMSKAMDLWRKAAEQGSAPAQYRLGEAYSTGRGGVKIDKEEGIKWLKKSAVQNDTDASRNARAQLFMGDKYHSGTGVKQDDKQASIWWNKADETANASYRGMAIKMKALAEQGNVLAQDFLGHLYYQGYGVEKDDAQAANWWHKAAASGNAGAQYMLGWMADSIPQPPPDPSLVEAEKTLRSAEDTQTMHFINGDIQLHENPNFCTAWKGIVMAMPIGQPKPMWSPELQKQAEQGNMYAETTLGKIYQEGNGIKQDDAEAFKWFSKAADKGNAYAQLSEGETYETGKGVVKDPEKAYYLLSRVTIGEMLNEDYFKARYWCTKAQADLTPEQRDKVQDKIRKWVALRNTGLPAPVPADQDNHYKLAFEEFLFLAEKGNMKAQEELSMLYGSGEGVKQDEVESFKWQLRAAKQDREAAFNLVGKYQSGQGVKQDWVEAYFWKSVWQKPYVLTNYVGPEDITSHLTAEQIAAVKERVNQFKFVPEVTNP